MKKAKNLVLIVVMAILATMIVSSCSNNSISSKSESTTENSTIILNHAEETSSKNTDVSNGVEITNEIGGGDLGLLKYRMNYYDVPAPFAEIIESEIFENWYVEVISENPNETNIMVMKRFIDYFNISREDFEKANLKWAKIIKEEMDGEPVMNPKDFANQELEEVYNTDVLYTLDDQTINDYYLSHDYPYVYSYDYKKAVENGEYVTQTTNWIDIEQMEAEIIAKYGETEIIPKTTIVTLEETVATELSQIETTE